MSPYSTSQSTASQGPYSGYAAPPAYTVNPKTNGLAIASLVLSLVGFTIVAVILGHIARGQIRRTGEQGAGLALAGLIIGYATLALGLVVVFGFVLFAGSVGLFTGS
jgi:hypothetical protein